MNLARFNREESGHVSREFLQGSSASLNHGSYDQLKAYSDPQKPLKSVLFPDGESWTNTVPRGVTQRGGRQQVLPPQPEPPVPPRKVRIRIQGGYVDVFGAEFPSALRAKHAALLDARVETSNSSNSSLQSLIRRGVMTISPLREVHQDGGGNTTEIYYTSTVYQFQGIETQYVALQHHANGHPDQVPRAHFHIRPAYLSDVRVNNRQVIYFESNGQLPTGIPLEHYFY